MGPHFCYGCMEKLTAYPCPRCGYTPGNGTLPYALQPGTILNGKYLVGKVLGQGGFGITYIGWDLQLERKVAIKEYFPSGHVNRKHGTGTLLWYSGNATQTALLDGKEMFLKEARKMSKVGTIAQVVQVFSVFQENETAYICMDFAEGTTLKDWLKKAGPLTWEQAKQVFLPVMAAMEQVHKAGLIHRDISPDNLMIQPGGGVKILDLGAAKDLNLNTGKSSMQVAKSGFSPLEQYMQRGASGTWTDVYALAATMYYALTGVLPPPAIDRMDKECIAWNLPRLQSIPPAALEAIKRAMALRPADRTQTMADFSGELLETKPFRQKKNPGNAQRTAKKKKWLIPALAVAALALVIFVGILLGSGGAQPNNGPAPGNSGQSPGQSSMNLWQAEIDELIEACDLEIYNYRNGSRMEMYFDDQNQECLRIFVNAQGHDQYIFLARYDDQGYILERYGFEDQTLMRSSTWTRNADGNVTELKNCDGSGTLISATQISYDDQGRSVFRRTLDANGNVTMEASSTYDASGVETYSGTRSDGESFEYIYDTDGNLLEGVTIDSEGRQSYRFVYRRDSHGNVLEYISYDPDGSVSYRSEYEYSGDLQVRETSYSYYEDSEYISEYEFIYGPRNIRFGQEYLDNEYGSISERVEGINGSWSLQDLITYTGTNPHTQVSLYSWDGNYLGDETYDNSGNLIQKTENIFDASGMQTGSLRTSYESDGSYTVDEIDASYNTLVSRTYDTTGNLINIKENRYDMFGKWAGSVSTYYYRDGSYMVTEENSDYQVVSQKTYDVNGNLIGSE